MNCLLNKYIKQKKTKSTVRVGLRWMKRKTLKTCIPFYNHWEYLLGLNGLGNSPNRRWLQRFG